MKNHFPIFLGATHDTSVVGQLMRPHSWHCPPRRCLYCYDLRPTSQVLQWGKHYFDHFQCIQGLPTQDDLVHVRQGMDKKDWGLLLLENLVLQVASHHTSLRTVVDEMIDDFHFTPLFLDAGNLFHPEVTPGTSTLIPQLCGYLFLVQEGQGVWHCVRKLYTQDCSSWVPPAHQKPLEKFGYRQQRRCPSTPRVRRNPCQCVPVAPHFVVDRTRSGTFRVLEKDVLCHAHCPRGSLRNLHVWRVPRCPDSPPLLPVKPLPLPPFPLPLPPSMSTENQWSALLHSFPSARAAEVRARSG